MLKILQASPGGVQVKELSQRLECTPKTVHKEIHLMNAILPEQYALFAFPSAGKVKLTYKKKVSIDTMITMLAKQTLPYQIMNYLLHDKRYTIVQLMKELNVSRTVIFTTLRHMNEILTERYQISISTAPLSFVGKEEDIRFCFFVFYSAFGDNAIIDKDSERAASELINRSHQLGLDCLHFSHFYVTIWLSILKLRWQQRQFVILNEEMETNFADRRNFQLVSAFIKDYYRSFYSGEIPEGEVIWLYIVSLHCVSYTDAKEDTKYVYRRKEFPEVLVTIRQFLGMVFPQEMLENGALGKMEAFLVNVRLLSKMSARFELVAPALHELIKEMHEEHYLQWLECLESLGQDSLLSFSHPEDLAVSLTVLHVSVLKTEHSKPKHVLFALQGDVGMEEYIAHVVEQLIPKQLLVTYYIEQAVTKEVIQEKGVDLMVCNYDLNLIGETTCPILRLSNIPTLADWRRLQDMVAQLNR